MPMADSSRYRAETVTTLYHAIILQMKKKEKQFERGIINFLALKTGSMQYSTYLHPSSRVMTN